MNKRTLINSASEQTLRVAQQAFEQFKNGLAQGNWEPFLEMLTEDFTFYFPAGPYKGQNQGKAKLGAFLKYASEQVFTEGLLLTLERITTSESTVMFEARSEGLMWGKPYENQVAIAFDIQGDRICCYREYLGVIFTLPVSESPNSTQDS